MGEGPKKSAERIGKMRNNKFAHLKYNNGVCLRVNTDYITIYGYSADSDETIIALLGDVDVTRIPGNQMDEIASAARYGIETERRR